MDLSGMLQITKQHTWHKEGLSQERVRAQLPHLRNLIAFYRQYPDYLVDQIKGKNSTFRFYFYQRVFLRVVMRHRYTYATFPRAYSKSFLSMLILMLRCILYPGSHLFVTTGGKEQAASITLAKIDELCSLIPAFNNEIDWSRGASKKSRDSVVYIFKNGSKLDILAARQSSRGQRRTGGLMEQCILIDGTTLNEIIIPTTNVDRLLPDGSRCREQKVNQSQIYITTAGYKNSFAYDKLIDLLIQSLVEPGEVMIMGGSYQTPVKEGLLNEDFVEQLKLAGTYNEDSFDREYRSRWAGDVDGAFYSAERFDKQRVLLQPEYEASGRASKSAYYVIGVDVGRIGCTTEACVFKVTPQPQGSAIKSLVNLYSYEGQHFEEQAIHIKKLYYKYNARKLAIDANGLGIGLIDYMVTPQVDPETNETLPPFGIDNDQDGMYKKMRTPETVPDAIFMIKANAPMNTDMYTYAQSQLSSGKIKLLIDSMSAKVKLMQTKVGQNMTPQQRNDNLLPFVLTDRLKDQMMNLVQENEGVNIILKPSNKSVGHDRFSAFIYGLYYIEQQQKHAGRRKRFNISDYLLFN